MKRGGWWLFVLMLVLSFSFSGKDGYRILPLHLSWEEVMRCDCLIAKSNKDYLNKDLFFARDSAGDYGLIQLYAHRPETKVPITKKKLMRRRLGTAWSETYSDDTLSIVLKAIPHPKRYLNGYSYTFDFMMAAGVEHKRDTIRETLWGHCKF